LNHFQDGVLIHIGVQEKQSIPVDSIIAILGKGGEDINAILASVNSAGSAPATTSELQKQKLLFKQLRSCKYNKQHQLFFSNDGRVKASPLAKALAKEKGIDISKVTGSGDHGRVTKSDIENYKPASQLQAVKFKR
jgi:pyruvate dehydrogenase E2 component (dihydrolipoamide acetyltransferase)